MSSALWAALLLAATGLTLGLPIFAPSFEAGAALCAVLVMGLLTLALREGSPRARLLRALCVTALVVAAQLALWPALAALGAREHSLSFLSVPLHALLRLLGASVHRDGTDLWLDAGAHVVPFRINWEKLGLLHLAWMLVGLCASACVLELRWSWKRSARLLAIAGVFVLVRLTLLALAYAEHPDPLALQAPAWSAISLFVDPRAQGLSMLPLAWLLGIGLPFERHELRTRALRTRPGMRPLTAALALGLAATAGTFAAGFIQPGARKAGRVLIDELHSAGWQTSAAAVGTQAYGRNSVYNCAAMVDLLAQHYEVKLNRGRTYDDAILADVDVLVLKTPTVPFTVEEADAIHAFVERGGGLWLLGDHTDLLGMTSNINTVAERFGMRFRRDAVNQLVGMGFHSAGLPGLATHPVMDGVERLSFMTSCSLDVGFDVEAVIVAGNCFSDPADYSSYSFFGNVRPDPGEDFGVLVMSAAKRVGEGRVLSLADTTILSNFGLYLEDRSELVLQSVEYLNRSGAGSRVWHRVGWALGAGLLALAVCLVRRDGPGRAWLGWLGIPALLVGVQLGQRTAEHLGESHLAPPPARAQRPTIAFVDAGCDYELPPALVHYPGDPARAFDPLLSAAQRVGYAPRQLSFERALEADAIVVVNPIEALTAAQRARLEGYVYRGGRLLVLDSVRNTHSQAGSWLASFGLAFGAQMRLVDNLCAKPDARPDPSGESVDAEEVAALGADDPLRFGGLSAPALTAHVGFPILAAVGGTSIFLTADEGLSTACMATIGRGRVIAWSDSVSFSRARMGAPEDELHAQDPRREMYELAYSLLRNYLMAP